MLLFGILQLFSLTVTVTCKFKMMITYGTPEDFIDSVITEVSWDQCVTGCLEDTMCMVAYQLDDTRCQKFQVGQLQTARYLENGENLLAIKSLSTDNTCPPDILSESLSGYGTDNPITSYQPYTVTFSGEIWTFSSLQRLTCPVNWQMFLRPRGARCLQIIDSKTCLTQSSANTTCQSYGGLLSGPETSEEYQFMYDKSLKIWSQFSKITKHATYGFWMDGVRWCTAVAPVCTGTNEFKFSDPTLSAVPGGYLWQKNQPARDGTCIALRIKPSEDNPSGMDDCGCTITANSDVCMRGYVCGVAPR